MAQSMIEVWNLDGHMLSVTASRDLLPQENSILNYDEFELLCYIDQLKFACCRTSGNWWTRPRKAIHCPFLWFHGSHDGFTRCWCHWTHIEITSNRYIISILSNSCLEKKHDIHHESQSGLNCHHFLILLHFRRGCIGTQEWSQLPLLYPERLCRIPLLDQTLLKVCKDGQTWCSWSITVLLCFMHLHTQFIQRM